MPWRLSSLALLAVLLLAACQPQGGSAPLPSSLPSIPSLEVTPLPKPTPTPASSKLPVADLRVAVEVAPVVQLLPGQPALRLWADPLYDDILGIGDETAPDAKQGLAQSWRVSPDGLTWELNLRENVRFHDGSLARASDVKFSLEWQDGGDDPARARLGSIVVPDPFTVRLHLKQSELFFAERTLSGLSINAGILLPREYIEGKGADFAGRNPIGSGPYRFKGAGLGSVLFEASDNHWYYGTARFKTLEFRYLPGDVTRVAALKTGAVDLARVPRQAASELKAARFDVQSKVPDHTGVVLLHEQYRVGNPLGNAAVRKALEMAVDRKLLAATLLRGFAAPEASFPVPPLSPAYNPAGVPDQDLKGAKALLAEAGYPAGFDLNVVLAPWKDLPEGQEVMEQIEGWWQKIGVRTNEILLDVDQFARAWREQTFALPTVHGVALLPADVPGLTWGAWTGAESPTRLAVDPELEDLAARVTVARAIPDFVKLSQEYERLFQGRIIAIPLFTTSDLYAIRVGLGGEKWRPGGGSASINIKSFLTGKAY